MVSVQQRPVDIMAQAIAVALQAAGVVPEDHAGEKGGNPSLAGIGPRSYGAVTPYDYGRFGMKHDVAGAPITVGYSHGPGGNLSYPGVDPAVFHTVVGQFGMLGRLPAVPSRETNPTYAIITGVDADSGDEKDGVCDDAPVAGLARTAMLTSVFGRYERSTAQIELNRLGQRTDRADPMDLALVGSPIQTTGLFDTGPAAQSTPRDMLQNEVDRKFWELSVALNRLLTRQIWIGNPANNSGGEGYKEVTGLDLLINTGHVDALTGVAVPALDSQAYDFGSVDIEADGTAIVSELTAMYRYQLDLARRTGMMPVRWVLAMLPEVFYALTNVWPCAYLTFRCGLDGDSAARVLVDGSEQVRMRDDLRNGSYLILDGDRVEVVVDDGIPEIDASNGCFKSSIYLIPMSVTGGRAVTYLEYFEYANPDIAAALGNMVLAEVDGPWITTVRQRNWCVQWQVKIEPRVVLRTPWLAARLDNVVTCPPQRMRNPFPESAYSLGAGDGSGGVTSRPGPSLYNGLY